MGSYFNVDNSGNLRAASIENTPIGANTPSNGIFTSLKCNHAVFSNMDFGSFNIGAVGPGSITSASITFNVSSFSGSPNILCIATALGFSDTNIARVTCGVHSVGINGFTVAATIDDPIAIGLGSVVIYWFAFE